MVKNLKEWCGMDHRPIWTEVGVSSLGAEGMRVEVEVEAEVKVKVKAEAEAEVKAEC